MTGKPDFKGPGFVLEWLLEPDNPSVRYYALCDLKQTALEADREAIMSQGLVPRILEKQNPDGSWATPERFYNDKYTGTVWTLLTLAELGADPADSQVRKACEFILAHSQNPATGGFSYTQSMKSGDGLASGVIPCLTGNMVFTLVKLGWLDDPRVQRAINWIVTTQRADDGDSGKPAGEQYQRFYMCWGAHSCHMGVAKAFKALAAIPADHRSPEVQAKIRQLGEYFLIHHLYKKSHDLEQIAKPGWLRLGFPLMYQTDILELLEIFQSLAWLDPRLDDAVAILRKKQLPDGRWNLDNTFNGRMNVRIEQKGEPSKWITLKALKVLAWYGDPSAQVK